jgi:hypothetical protein
MPFTVVLAVVMLSVTAFGQGTSATVTLKSGDKIPCQLVDLGGVGFTIMVGGQERRIQPSDVAMISFVGPGTAPPAGAETALANGQHVFVLKSGGMVTGEFYDIGGAGPLRLTVRTASGTRELSSNDVSQIYMAPVPGTPTRQPAPAVPPPAAPAPMNGQSVQVTGQTTWMMTGITVRRGQVVRFQATGEVVLNAGGDMRSTAAGMNGRFDKDAPVKNLPVGALIGRIGPGKPFAIGNQQSVTMPDNGPLMLGINDSNVRDNAGAFNVIVNATGRGPTR